MRNAKSIIIDIDEDGNCSISGKSFVGIECEAFIAEIEAAIGITTSSHEDRTASGRNFRRNEQRNLNRLTN